ncbi:lysylphosphatidylglycerol synthase transmembrane domain-containing protein [Alcaligenaceae bacterium A4P071]|nr:lysylphosphatidylglycerol synthase transmembrane domain-containing protein [Alcaligenaceae bacterium A4P071]
MRINHALISLGIVTAVYLGLLVWLDGERGVFALLPTLASAMPVLLVLTVASWLLRYARWWWLLRMAGHPLKGWRSLAAYLAGFAFTATPGKVGELVRIRYYGRQGVPAEAVVAAFVFERMLDLVAVLLLAFLGWGAFGGIYTTLLMFVTVIVAAVLACAFYPMLLQATGDRLAAWSMPRLAAIVRTVCAGVMGLRQWLTFGRVLVSLLFGLAAWGVTAGAFAWLLSELSIDLPWQQALAIYPAAMLAGAASMLPGGLGSTEAVIIALLGDQGVALALASLAAVGIRLATLWFAIVVGLIAVIRLESHDRAHAERRDSSSPA